MGKARRGGRGKGRGKAGGSHDRQASDGEGLGGLREHWRHDGRPKARFANEDDANRSAMRLRLEEGADLAPYRCRLCGSWHLGSSPD